MTSVFHEITSEGFGIHIYHPWLITDVMESC